jgi:hypothetical protein
MTNEGHMQAVHPLRQGPERDQLSYLARTIPPVRQRLSPDLLMQRRHLAAKALVNGDVSCPGSEPERFRYALGQVI